jgi:hypothetical protein
MNQLRFLPILLLLSMVIMACAPTTVTPPATPLPQSTIIMVENTPAPEQPTEVVEPTVAAENTPAPQPPTLTPAPTDEPAATPAATEEASPSTGDMAIPPAAIAIAQPASGSLVASPLIVRGEANPTFEQNLIIRLITADGTEISTTPTTIQADAGQRGAYEVSIDFDVTEQTPAFIQVYADSPMDGGIVSLSSVGVQLLPAAQAADADIIENEDVLEHIVITSPLPGDSISGGELVIQGIGRATFENTLVVEVTDADGNLLVNEALTVDAEVGGYGTFSANLLYLIVEETTARITIRDVSPAHGGDAFVSSINVRLSQ